MNWHSNAQGIIGPSLPVNDGRLLRIPPAQLDDDAVEANPCFRVAESDPSQPT